MKTEEKYDLAKWLAGEMDPDELKAFRNSPEFSQYERIANASLELRVDDFDEDGMLSRVLSQKQKPKIKTIPLYRSAFARIAAILVIALGLFFWLKPNRIIEKTAYSETASVVLPDNSEAILNSGSEIAYDKSSWKNDRKLSLKGEAFFKVAKGKTFEVETDLGKIQVVGTQFNVKAREKRLEVECFEGKVKVVASGSEMLLQKGDITIFENAKPVEATSSGTEKPAWMLGEIRFNSASLAQIAAEFERRFGIKIKIEAQTTQTMTGSFAANDAQKAIETLCSIYKLNAKTENDAVVLSANE